MHFSNKLSLPLSPTPSPRRLPRTRASWLLALVGAAALVPGNTITDNINHLISSRRTLRLPQICGSCAKTLLSPLSPPPFPFP